MLPAVDGRGDGLGIRTLLVLILSPGNCKNFELGGTCSERKLRQPIKSDSVTPKNYNIN